MAYILFSFILLSLILGTVLYLTRERWTAYLPSRMQDAMYSRLPTTFMGDVEGGFTSADFDLSSNITEGDSRQGLDPKSKREVQRLMKIRGIGFDEARRVYMEQSFKKAGIGSDGVPRDPKFVSFS
ncbi:uncharacterized protein HMPREF1541_04836 [Cyphellophora europaea CBS 101466]|uniref:Uncharacterized protein n=1 Tax=Cyphellophora europaea (strain CBS 101466) TaxID=1220924 RepID=W2RY07_CYPE1|nr:uncharacterized protein HMPREF1541_04836 [Cyphellophora europaea CBS 101466]ETN40559.1 hypothetical protein HMPREF1541_04836 [Cyphellophora europaea CBS 101466]